MIIDFIKNVKKYSVIPHLEKIEKYIGENNCLTVPDGEHEIFGRDLFVRVASYQTGVKEEKPFEAHQVYADLQFVVSGAEEMEGSLDAAKAVSPYNKEADIQFFETPERSSALLVSAGQFAFFLPGELHRPGCHPGGCPAQVKKLVFKIKMGQAPG